MSAPRFPSEGLEFLRGLKRNNKRPWFQKRKGDYEQYVKAPMVEIVMALAHDLPEGVVADPAKSVLRIYRDVRFSKNKLPYKTHVAARFLPRGRPNLEGAGLYFHISSEEVWIGGGYYAPTPAELLAVRTRIADKPAQFAGILKAKEFRTLFGKLQGAKLTRVPRGFPSDHPAAEWLKHKQWFAGAKLPATIAVSPKFYQTLVAHFTALVPLIRFLNAQ